MDGKRRYPAALSRTGALWVPRRDNPNAGAGPPAHAVVAHRGSALGLATSLLSRDRDRVVIEEHEADAGRPQGGDGRVAGA